MMPTESFTAILKKLDVIAVPDDAQGVAFRKSYPDFTGMADLFFHFSKIRLYYRPSIY